MATKWKSIRYALYLKAFAVVAAVAGMLTMAHGTLMLPYVPYAYRNPDVWGGAVSAAEIAHYRMLGQTCILEGLVGGLLLLGAVLYLIYAAGRRNGSEEVHLLWSDRIYNDVSLAVTVPLLLGAMLLLLPLYESLYETNWELFVMLAGTLVTAGTLLGILTGTALVKRIKRRELFRHTLAAAVLRWLFGPLYRLATGLRAALHRSAIGVRVAAWFGVFVAAQVAMFLLTVVLASALTLIGLIAGGIIFLAVNGAALLFVLRKVKLIEAMNEDTAKIRAGEVGHRVSRPEEPVLEALADNINYLADGLTVSLENEVRAERLKAELVTNVSHDLKTPLTSIITYVDLLKREGVCSENAPHYVDVLEQKAQRLKGLTEDLFEAAKASSGNLAYTLEPLDVSELISQGLGELTDQIEASGLQFRISAPEEKAAALGDGRLLWRVMENLLSNVFKYAQPGSRVYIETAALEGWVRITVKNISAFELNVPVEELMERFKRGDESRHSEGSGLGLSIARSLTELQGGRFAVAVDGDLFKAEVSLPEYKA